jgi:proline utilization trans-activator
MQGAGFAPDTVASSSLHFSSQISRLRTVNSHPERNSQNPPSDGDMSSTTDIYGLGQLRDQSTPLNLRWPTLAEAHELLDIVLKSVGKLQHLIEPRMTSDRLSLTYQGSPSPRSSNDLWYNELLMIFALGDLLRGRLGENTRLPGIQYFVEAERCLPCLPQLRAMGLHAIGVLGMMAFYLQCADSRDDAYVYVSST